MHNSTVQLVLFGCLSAGLGYALSSQPAEGYPGGAAVSLGSNPIVAASGIVDAETISILTAPSGHAVIVTDVVLSYRNGNCHSHIELNTSSGVRLGTFRLWQSHNSQHSSDATSIQHSFQSGLPLPPGEALSITEDAGCNVAYTVSGYIAQP